MHQLLNFDLNAICPYFTMFPLDFPLRILRTHSKVGDIVLDPFCGRGTTNYASRLMGLQSIGIDSSPVAVAISQAKMAITTSKKIVEIAKDIIENSVAKQVPEGDFWSLAYHKDVLRDICKIRESLLVNCDSDAKKALRGIMLGALHGPRKKQGSSYFSNQSQRTYAPKPNYALNYWKENQLSPDKVNVIDIVRNRAEKYYRDQNKTRGEILKGDSRLGSTFLPIKNNVNWIITSPPYYGMRTYLPDQWLRLWFVGGNPEVNYSADGQVKHSSQSDFTNDLRTVWRNVASICNKDARLIVRFGKLSDRDASPIDTIKESLADTQWKCKTVKSAGTAAKGFRQAKHMNKNTSIASEEFDVWAGLDV